MIMASTKTRAFIIAAVSTALIAVAPHARAQQDAASAEALFRDGMTLLDSGRYAEACQKLADSHKLDPASGTLLALALCHEKQGHTASAWAAYVDAANLARRDGRRDREETAQRRAAELEKQLARLTIDLSPAARAITGIDVKRDGQSVPASAIGSPLPIDPGEHVIEASAPRKRPTRLTVRIEPSNATAVTIPDLADEVAAAPASADPVHAEEPRGFHPRRTLGVIIGGVGLASIAAGGLFGMQAFSKADESRERCPSSRCSDRSALDLNDDARAAATLSNVFIGVGAAAAVAGAVLFFTAPTSRSTARLRLDVGAGAIFLGGEL